MQIFEILLFRIKFCFYKTLIVSWLQDLQTASAPVNAICEIVFLTYYYNAYMYHGSGMLICLKVQCNFILWLLFR